MYRFVLIVGLTLLLPSCGLVAQAPTATPPPTATPLPTATPPPPTATLPPPTATPLPTARTADAAADSADLLSGVQAASTARRYRVEVSMSGNGTMGAVNLGNPQTPAEVMVLKGAFADADYTFTLTGFVTALYGSNSAKGIQVVHVAGQDYIHGPLAVIGAIKDAWYRLPAAHSQMAIPPLYPAGLLALVAQSGVNPAGFSVIGHEQIDRLDCRRFSGDRAVSLAIIKSLGDSGLPIDTIPAHIERASSELWVCADGYLHQVRLTVAGSTPAAKPLPFDFVIGLHMYDFDTDVGIAVPDPALDILLSPSP